MARGKRRVTRREREREERRRAPTILINPVPGAHRARSRSNRVHDLQGIYIRSSTRGYNSIPSLYSALSSGALTDGGPLRASAGRTHIILARDPATAPTLPLSRRGSKIVASLPRTLAPRQDLGGLILSLRRVSYRRRQRRERWSFSFILLFILFLFHEKTFLLGSACRTYALTRASCVTSKYLNDK